MAWGYTGGATNGGTATSASITHGLTINSGDLVVAYINCNNTGAISNDAGGAAWTNPINEVPSTETSRHAFFWKVAGSSEPATYTWTLPASTQYRVIVKVFTSATDAVQDTAAVTTKDASPVSNLVCEATNGITVADDSLSVVFGGKDNRNPADAYTTANNSYTGVVGDAADQSAGGAHRIFTTGQSLPAAVTISGAVDDNDFTYSVHMSFVESTAGGTTVNLTGQSITSAQGTVTATGGAIVSLAGQSTTASQGTLTVVTGGAVTVALSGQSITSAQGLVTATGAAVVGLSGQEITPSFGTLLATGAANVTLNGQEATLSQGVVTVTTAAAPTVVSLSGQSIASNIGTLGLQTANVILLAGQEVTMLQGSVTAGTPPVIPDVTGVTVGGRFGEGYSVTAVFGEGVTKKGRL